MTHESELDYLSSTSHNYTQDGGNLIDTLKGLFTKKNNESASEKKETHPEFNTGRSPKEEPYKETYESKYGNQDPVGLMLKSASENNYEKVFDVYVTYLSADENNYEKLNFAQQDKSGNTILHYLAKDKIIVKYKDSADDSAKKSFNLQRFKNYIKSIPQKISEFLTSVGLTVLVTSIIAHPKNKSFINIQNNDGDTAAILAQKNGNYFFIDLLVEAKADLDICNKLGFKIQPVTETETSNNLHKFELFESESCNKSNKQVTQSDDLRSINISQIGGDFFEDFKNYFAKKSKKNDSDQYNGSTEDRLRYLAEKAKASDTSNTNTHNYNKFLGQVAEDNFSNKNSNEGYDRTYTDKSVETSEILKNLMQEDKSNKQYKMGTSTAANELIKEENMKSNEKRREDTDDFVNQVVAKYRKAMNNKEKTPNASATPPMSMQPSGEAMQPQGETMAPPLQQMGGQRKNKITGQRKLFKYDLPKKSKNYMYDSLDDDNMEGGLSSDSSSSSMNSLQRVTQQTIRDIEDRIIANIKKLMKITDDEEARDYRSGAWYFYREKKGDALFDMKKLDKTIEFEKFITEDILKKVNLKEARKRRLENREKQQQMKEANSSSSQSNSSFTSTNSSTPTSMSSSSEKPKKATKAKTTKAKKEGSIRVTEYSLDSSLSDMNFSDSSSYSSSYGFSNKNILPSTTSSFNSYTSSSAF